MKNQKDRRKHSGFSRLRIWLSTVRAGIDSSYGRDRLADFRDRIRGIMPTGEQDLILAACDDGYFEKFAVSLLSSMSVRPETHSIHLHLLKPSEKTIARAEALRNGYANVRLSYTIDLCEDAHTANPTGIYYTAARFILAPLLLEQGVKRLFIIDVDSVMNKSPWPIIDTMPEDTSAAFVFRPEKRRAWQKILANAVLFKADEVSHLFAERFARALLMNVSRPQEYYVDQVIPFYLIDGGASATRSRIKCLPNTLNSLEYGEDAAFWTAKGVDKHSEQFAAAQSAQSRLPVQEAG
ncbi:hypothetical protein GOB98_28900 [Sinorhizobium meliloti]|nr:hypothetical protein [Sinorhizobium meliloti]MDW9980008.1 hypothetical protein [Sinorhizobium meliloti]MDX0296602.1 hypothetical protein [Sinorhizobium meliloti]